MYVTFCENSSAMFIHGQACTRIVPDLTTLESWVAALILHCDSTVFVVVNIAICECTFTLLEYSDSGTRAVPDLAIVQLWVAALSVDCYASSGV